MLGKQEGRFLRFFFHAARVAALCRLRVSSVLELLTSQDISHNVFVLVFFHTVRVAALCRLRVSSILELLTSEAFRATRFLYKHTYNILSSPTSIEPSRHFCLQCVS